ncbi:MAG: hypothetical protein OEW77_12685 [Gemmatimonadota bacterium]|nr:hypothetical protein [Gemmatimonadota bacterium]
MRSVPLLLTLALLAACAPKEEKPAAETAPPPPPYAAFAGTWATATTIEGVKDPVQATLTITADGAGSSMSLEGRPNIALTLSMSGDSLIATSAEYESVLRKGVMVTTRSANVMQGDMMMGSMEATYKTPAGPELVKGTSESKRAP